MKKDEIKRLAIIPARGGSKRFPMKNMANLGGKPMIYHTIDAAIGLFDKIIITSDGDDILKVVREKYDNYSGLDNCEIDIQQRPDELATDTSKVLDTVNYYYDRETGFDQIWLLLPTCPLRTSEDISQAQVELTDKLDTILSITEYEFPPSLGLLQDENGKLSSYDASDPWRNGNTRSQDHPVVHRPNGAVYGSWWSAFGENRNFYKGNVQGYFMPRSRSVDIDTKLDLQIAEVMLKDQ